jgi:hypothetical protein
MILDCLSHQRINLSNAAISQMSAPTLTLNSTTNGTRYVAASHPRT